MSDNLGSDFNSSRPQDGERAERVTGEQGATSIRDLKTRLKNFFGVLFDIDSGDLQDNVVRAAALKSATSPIAGTYKKVKTNKKGVVIRGWEEVDETVPRIFRAVFFGDPAKTSYYESDGDTALVAVALHQVKLWSDGGSSRWYETFTVPDGVTRIRFWCIGAGSAGTVSLPGMGGAHVEGTLVVASGDEVHVYAGMSGDAAIPSQGGRSRIWVGSLAGTEKYLDALGGTTFGTGNVSLSADVSAFGVYQTIRGRSYFKNLALGGAVAEDGLPGMVVFEWYA